MDLETHALALCLPTESGQRVGTEMQPDRVRWIEVQRVGAAATSCRHRHHHWRDEPARLAEQIANGLLRDEREIAGEEEHRVRAPFGCANDAALGGDVLAFLPRLDQNLSAQR